MNNQPVIKLPRLYVDGEFTPGTPLDLPADQLHYLRTVLRRKEGDQVRLFNGRQGEWLAILASLDRKSASLLPEEQIRPQPPEEPETWLLVSPIKKNRMEWLIEKAVELGATHIQPVQTQNTDIPHINEERVRRQIIEAAEQCERLTLPALMPLVKLTPLLSDWPDDVPLLACLERNSDLPFPGEIAAPDGKVAFLVGPEGGFTAGEVAAIKAHPAAKPVSLGNNTLRTETAVCAALAMRLAGSGLSRSAEKTEIKD